ncbi:MAG: hypothetical protein JXO22_12905, partial [Phycisphaerae bacterium]|nr:hypothetical protein [Phycisphaerae bacterium]
MNHAVLANFLLQQPGQLAAASGVIVVATLLCRHWRPQVAGASLHRGAVRAVLSAALVIVVAWLLVWAETPASQTMLAMLALASVAWCVAGTHGRPYGGLSRSSRLFMGLLRVGAWLVVLVLLGRPAWESRQIRWQKPLLVALLDQSTSMNIADMPTRDGGLISRGAIVNAALAEVPQALGRLDEYYDLRRVSIGETPRAMNAWCIEPTENLSAMSAALRHAGDIRARDESAPLAVLVISDGAETVAAREALIDAGQRLAAQGTAVLAIGVGPEPGTVPTVELALLNTPARIGQRERLPVAIDARITGCAGREVSVTMHWDDDVVSETRIGISEADERLRRDEIVVPPTPGVHRLTATVAPLTVDGVSASRSAIVDVAEAATRVLLLDGRPHSEMAFIYRALADDSDLDVARFVWFGAAADSDPPRWDEYDAIVLGQVEPATLTSQTQTRLAEAVRDGGSGLLLAGGQRLFNQGDYRGSVLADLSPTSFETLIADADYRPHFVPTELGLVHPIFAGLGDEADSWAALPPMGGCAYLGRRLKPLAEVLATADGRQPALVVHEVGRGRCGAAAWESTWPWALSSDAGYELHRRFWRQMVRWLANRRPSPWVLTDRTRYAADALEAGQVVEVRAGISGTPTRGESSAVDAAPTLRLRRVVDESSPEDS